MFNNFERMVAMRYLRSRRSEGFISIIAGFSFLGITLGVATLIVVMAVMNGFHKELLTRILGLNSHISIYHISRTIDSNYHDLSSNIKSLNGISNASPLVQGQVLASANNHNTGAMVRGMYLSDIKKKKMIAGNLKHGQLWNDDDASDYVIIGSKMAESMRLTIGDNIRLISPKTTSTFIGDIPRIKDYKIVGIFEIGMYEYDSSTIFMPFKAAQIYFKLKNKASSIEVDVVNSDDVENIKQKIIQNLGDTYRTIDWKEANMSYFSSLKVERNVMFMILTLIIVIAAFNIVSGMVMLVSDKGKEIAILRTIGASKSSIIQIFFMCGATIGVVGTICGVLLGVAFAVNIQSIRHFLENLTESKFFAEEVYFLSKLPADLQNHDVMMVALMSLVISLLATIYPSWKAAKISPAEGVRYE